MGKAILGFVWLAIVTSVSASDAPEVTALQAYAFAPRNEQSREGVRTDALLVIRDGVHASDIVRRIVTDWQSSGLGTVSAGTAVRNGDDSAADVYMRADRNLYAAKRARGR